MEIFAKVRCVLHTYHRTSFHLCPSVGSVLCYSPFKAVRPPFACGHCKTREYINVWVHHPSPGDYGQLIVRRPGKLIQVQKWRMVRLGE